MLELARKVTLTCVWDGATAVHVEARSAVVLAIAFVAPWGLCRVFVNATVSNPVCTPLPTRVCTAGSDGTGRGDHNFRVHPLTCFMFECFVMFRADITRITVARCLTNSGLSLCGLLCRNLT
jgi:hypothetical protein